MDNQLQLLPPEDFIRSHGIIEGVVFRPNTTVTTLMSQAKLLWFRNKIMYVGERDTLEPRGKVRKIDRRAQLLSKVFWGFEWVLCYVYDPLLQTWLLYRINGNTTSEIASDFLEKGLFEDIIMNPRGDGVPLPLTIRSCVAHGIKSLTAQYTTIDKKEHTRNDNEIIRASASTIQLLSDKNVPAMTTTVKGLRHYYKLLYTRQELEQASVALEGFLYSHTQFISLFNGVLHNNKLLSKCPIVAAMYATYLDDKPPAHQMAHEFWTKVCKTNLDEDDPAHLLRTWLLYPQVRGRRITELRELQPAQFNMCCQAWHLSKHGQKRPSLRCNLNAPIVLWVQRQNKIRYMD